jgi:LmbE family N-acetylglucosaminyl deacetylase
VGLVVGNDEQRVFTRVGPGTLATAWRRHPQWGTGTPLRLEGVSRLVVAAAHPDDESLGAGGLVATATGRGLAVDIVCATDGEGSHPDSPTHSPEDLARTRVLEAEQAAQALGVQAATDTGHLHRLQLPDGGVGDHEDEVTTRLVEVVGDGCGTVLVAPWRRDGHPDHEAVGRAAAAAARHTGAELWEYPIWFWHWAHPEEGPWSQLHPFELDDEALAAKARAIRTHASQVGPLSSLEGDETLLPPEMLAHFADGPEHYLRTASGGARPPATR